jgi:hypothetical protein
MDQRVKHYSAGPSLLNQRPPEYPGAARALYTDRGPIGPANTGRRKPLSGEPMSIEHHIDDCLARVKGLSPGQKTALKAELGRMFRDLSFLRELTEQARASGPWSQAAVTTDSQGNVYSG